MLLRIKIKLNQFLYAFGYSFRFFIFFHADLEGKIPLIFGFSLLRIHPPMRT